MTTIPKPADPTQSFTATYDAWNRLVKIEESGNTVAQYEYDGAKRRSVKRTYSGGQLDETRHFFYTEPSRWQVIEERVGSSITPDRHFVWGCRYIDDLILRDRDTSVGGTLDERFYGMQDANWNVSGITSAGGLVQERYGYHPYGTPVVLTGAFAFRASSNFDWETMFAGYRWDRAVTLFHVRNRVYATNSGKWLQRDPIGLSAGTNLYGYSAADPVGRADPSGKMPLSPHQEAFVRAFADCVAVLAPEMLCVAVALCATAAVFCIPGVWLGPIPWKICFLASCAVAVTAFVGNTLAVCAVDAYLQVYRGFPRFF